MKRLVVMRHADAAGASKDIERPLSTRGLSQATASALELKDVFTPQLVLVSPALRTRMTSEQLSSVFAWSSDYCQFESVIYNASSSTLSSLLRNVDDSVDDLLLIGHNPGVSELVNSLIGHYAVSYSPGTFSIMTIAIDKWSSLGSSAVTLESSYSPK